MISQGVFDVSWLWTLRVVKAPVLRFEASIEAQILGNISRQVLQLIHFLAEISLQRKQFRALKIWKNILFQGI